MAYHRRKVRRLLLRVSDKSFGSNRQRAGLINAYDLVASGGFVSPQRRKPQRKQQNLKFNNDKI